MEITKKKILITGASSGIGRELAYQIASKKNVDLILVARRTEALEKVAKKCESNEGVSTKIYSVDIGLQGEVDELVRDVDDVDILINAAGYGIMKGFDEFTDYEVVKMFDTNVIGTIQLTSELAKKMKEKKSGNIVTVASLSGKIATPKTSVYSGTKFALLGYFNSLRLELKNYNIHVMTVNLGPVATNFFNASDDNKKYLKTIGGKPLTPKIVASKIIKGIEKNKREVNLPLKLVLGTKINQLFPSIGDIILLNMFKNNK
ncbi:SDR family NAD(P)-dependent oxidoreductase [Gemella cuniculi]|uniref:SDR family NAD(P)-dependent oxidoreductase n=1 Tax=Gemella cuniculi TaxID=150240 RepID=UPI00041E0997|nr:SDR family oxidoreductase [Gemella cuniculi]